MAKRRAGERLRLQARRRRREVLRAHWRRLLLGVALYSAVGTAMTLGMGWLFDREWGFAMGGAIIGAFMLFVLVFFQMLDPLGARIHRGLDGETWASEEIAKLRRHGWLYVPNLQLRDGDVDGVAIGPGGVIAIENKSSEAEWSFLERSGCAERWARQADRSAFRIRHLIKQHTKRDVDVAAYLVLWLPKQPDGPGQMVHGVTRINGWDLRRHLLTLPAVMEPADITSVFTALDLSAAQFDEAAGLTRSRRLRHR